MLEMSKAKWPIPTGHINIYIIPFLMPVLCHVSGWIWNCQFWWCYPTSWKFRVKPDDEKIAWINEICTNLLKKHFFNEGDDLMETLREILNDPNHPDNYWISNMNDGCVQCHFCERSYAYVGSLKTHEETKHNAKVPKPKTSKESDTRSDDVESYCNVLF